MPPPASSPAVAAVARGTIVPMWGHEVKHLWRQRQPPPKATPLPRLLPRPEIPRLPPPTHQTAFLANPIIRAVEQNEAHDDGEVEDVSSNGSMSTVGDVLRLMDALRLPVEADLYASLLKECTERSDAAHGTKVHTHMRRTAGNLLRGPGGALLANRLLLMYVVCGRMDQASEVFDDMPRRDTVSWATIIAGLSDAGNHRAVLRLFAEMVHHEGGPVRGRPAVVLSMATVLRSCAGAGDLTFGECVHGLVLKMRGDFSAAGDSRLGSCLIRFYSMLGRHDGAQKVFDSMNVCPSAAAVWNAAIAARCSMGMVGSALELLGETWKVKSRRRRRRLQSSLLSSILRACGSREEELPGRQVHACAVKLGVEGDALVRGSLVDMYARCGLVFDARRALETIIGRHWHHTVTAAFWRSLLDVFTEKGSSMDDAIRCLYDNHEVTVTE